MANKPSPEIRVYRHCTSFIVLGNGVLFIHKNGLWALYLLEKDRFLSNFVFTKPPDLPKFGQEDVWSLYIREQIILFDTKARVSIVTEEVCV